MIKQNKESSFSFIPKIIDRYVAREFFVSYLIALFVVLSLRIILDLFLEFDEFVESEAGGGAPGVFAVIGHILNYYGPKTLEFFRDFSGTIILLAAAFALTRMTRQNELTAILASGISLKRVIVPIVVLAFFLNLLMVIDQEFILPRFADKLVRRHDEMNQLRTVSAYLLPDRDSSLLSAPLYDPETKTITDLLVILRHEGRFAGTVTASEATWNEREGHWDLENGIWLDHRSEQEAAHALPYYPSDLTADYLWLQRNSAFKTLMSYNDLRNLQLRELLKPAESREVAAEKHFRFSDPIINMVMLLLSLPLLISRERRSTKIALSLACLGAGGCFIATFACKLLAGALLAPLLAAFIPIIIFAPLSVLALDSLKT